MNRVTILLMSILLVAASLRLVALSTNPPSTYWDETSLGYDAYSIKDRQRLSRKSFPNFSLSSFGDYKPSLYFYAIVPFMAVRLNNACHPSAFSVGGNCNDFVGVSHWKKLKDNG